MTKCLSNVFIYICLFVITLSGQPVESFIVESGHSGITVSIEFSADGKLLITAGGTDKDNVKIWDPFTGKLKSTINVDGLVTGLALAPGGG